MQAENSASWRLMCSRQTQTLDIAQLEQVKPHWHFSVVCNKNKTILLEESEQLKCFPKIPQHILETHIILHSHR